MCNQNQYISQHVDGLLGVYNRNGEPGRKPQASSMLKYMRHRGMDWKNLVSVGEVVLSCSALSSGFSSGAHRYTVSFHGTLDNKSELITRCGLDKTLFRSTVAVIAGLYQKKGDRFPALLEGDFVFIIWDKYERRLFCARDISGFKPFYYYVDNGIFLWASELKSIIKHPKVVVAPNEHCVAQHLLDKFCSTQDTLYKNVFRLPPAHSLTVTDRDCKLEKYWHPGDIEELHYHDDESYSEHLRELIEVSVRTCRGGSDHVGVMLSGGVDSSALFGVAAAQSKKLLSGGKLTALSNVFPGFDCDESSYIQAVLSKWPSPSLCYTPEPQTVAVCLQQAAFHGSIPDYPNGAMSNTLLQAAREANIAPILTGLGGDEWFAGNLYYFADYLFLLKLKKFLDQALDLPPNVVWSLGRDSLLYYSFNPLVPQWLKRIFRPSVRKESVPGWVRTELVQQFLKQEKRDCRLRLSTFRSSRALAMSFQAATSPFCIYAREMEERSAAIHGVEFRHPLFTKPVIEFALSLPVEQLSRGVTLKYAFRNSLRPYLPRMIYERQTKASYDRVIARSIFSCKSLMNGKMKIAEETGWVDRHKISVIASVLERAYRKDENYLYSKALWLIWSCLAIECWYRENF